MRFDSATDEEPEIQMVSMVDVIFILLAFFVLGMEFRLSELDFGLGYAQPRLTAGVRPEDLPETINVELRRKAGGVGITIGQAHLPDNDYGAIRATLTEINLPAIGVAVLAEPDLTVDQVARAMDAALASPMKKVSVASLPKAGAVAPSPSPTLGGDR